MFAASVVQECLVHNHDNHAQSKCRKGGAETFCAGLRSAMFDFEKIGSYLVINKVLNEYGIPELLGRHFDPKETGLFEDLMAYSLVCENNAAQYYPDYAFNHPLFTDDMHIYSDTKISEFLCGMTRDQSVGFLKENIRLMDENGYDFVMMVKGMSALVDELVLQNKGSFEDDRDYSIRRHQVYGKTVRRKLYADDEKERYFHLYHSVGEELQLCGYFVLVTSEKMTAEEALDLYYSRDASEKLFRGDKSYLGNKSLRGHTNESISARIFVEFVALIVRNRIYTLLREAVEEMDGKPNYMTVPAAIRELEKIEIVRGLDRIYRMDHAITKTQKIILKALGMDVPYVKSKAKRISEQLRNAEGRS